MLLFVGMGKVVLNCCSLLSNELQSCTELGGLLFPGEDVSEWGLPDPMHPML